LKNFLIQPLFTPTLPPYGTFGIHKKQLFSGLYARTMSVAHATGGARPDAQTCPQGQNIFQNLILRSKRNFAKNIKFFENYFRLRKNFH